MRRCSARRSRPWRCSGPHYFTTHPHWWDFAALAVYTTHFIAVTVIAMVLWTRSRAQYLRFMTWFVGLTTLGFVTYVLYPAVPPWLASQRGDLAQTHRIVRELWDYLGCHAIAAQFSGASVCRQRRVPRSHPCTRRIP